MSTSDKVCAWMNADGMVSTAPGGGYDIPLYARSAELAPKVTPEFAAEAIAELEEAKRKAANGVAPSVADTDAAKREHWRQWGIIGMPAHQIRLAEATWNAAIEASRSASAPSEFLTEVCDALFGCFASPAGEGRFVCGCCEWPIDMLNWIRAEHSADCIINRVRDYLGKHKPEALGHHNSGSSERTTDG